MIQQGILELRKGQPFHEDALHVYAFPVQRLQGPGRATENGGLGVGQCLQDRLCGFQLVLQDMDGFPLQAVAEHGRNRLPLAIVAQDEDTALPVIEAASVGNKASNMRLKSFVVGAGKSRGLRTSIVLALAGAEASRAWGRWVMPSRCVK